MPKSILNFPDHFRKKNCLNCKIKHPIATIGHTNWNFVGKLGKFCENNHTTGLESGKWETGMVERMEPKCLFIFLRHYKSVSIDILKKSLSSPLNIWSIWISIEDDYSSAVYKPNRMIFHAFYPKSASLNRCLYDIYMKIWPLYTNLTRVIFLVYLPFNGRILFVTL